MMYMTRATINVLRDDTYLEDEWWYWAGTFYVLPMAILVDVVLSPFYLLYYLAQQLGLRHPLRRLWTGS